jgi:hypothetical protein
MIMIDPLLDGVLKLKVDKNSEDVSYDALFSSLVYC